MVAGIIVRSFGTGGRDDMTNHEFLRDFQEKVDRKLRENEISVIQYWHERLRKLVSMKPEGIASLQLEIKKVYDMMENRIQTLKKG
jgi:chromosome condensin MukBEF MukE localization factor